MQIRPMTEQDTPQVIDMMRIFYRSPAVHTNGSEEIFHQDVKNCVTPNPYLEGYIFETDGFIQGYGMVAKSFSTEFGKPCVWIEDIYIKEGYRGMGIGSKFLAYISKKYSGCVIRLEVEEDNEAAVGAYKKAGFEALPYLEMIRLPRHSEFEP